MRKEPAKGLMDERTSNIASPFLVRTEEPIQRQSFGNDRDQFFKPYDEEQKEKNPNSYVSFKPQQV